MNQRIPIPFFVLLSLLFSGGISYGQERVHTPEPGSAERKAIMDVMRLDFYPKKPVEAHRNPEAVFFNVRFLKVNGDWALTCVDPVNAAGKEIAEPRWGLLHRKAGQWSDANYFDAILPYPADDFDAIDMTPRAIRNIWRAFPDVPRDIFPEIGKTVRHSRHIATPSVSSDVIP